MNQAQMHNTNVYRQVSVFLKKKVYVLTIQ